MSSTAPPPAPDRIGRYRIERKIGEGGMGVVYAAATNDSIAPSRSRRFAAQGTKPPAAGCGVKRALRPASHPNICQLYEVDETDERLVLAMELLAGEPLGAHLARGPLPPAEAAAIGLQVLDALGALHARGLTHRDLKPSNLFLTPHGVKLLDFGLARPITGSLSADTATRLTEVGAIVGTPNYMAPEQVRGDLLDARADLFAMAAILFEMLSGRPAFSGATVIDVLHAVLHEQPPALSGGATVTGLDRVIHRSLQRRPPSAR
jgi:eukaryotic-like serine/threonine-protein kinase